MKHCGGWISIIACSTYEEFHEKYDYLWDGNDDVGNIFKCQPRSVSTLVCIVFTK